MSKHEATAKQLVNKALAGDLSATRLVLQLRAQVVAEQAATAPVIDAEPELPDFNPTLLKTEELDILARPLERMEQRKPYHERPPVPVPPGEPWDPEDDG